MDLWVLVASESHEANFTLLLGLAECFDSAAASASSDEGTAHGMHFFKVVQVDKDLGSCK